jgi:hypothetical protein
VYDSERYFAPCLLVANALSIKANILIDKDGLARLADFGLLTILSDPTNYTASSSVVARGTTRWMSPELLDPDQFESSDGRPTEESDCYALGMVVYEVLSGKVPFASLKEYIVMRKVLEGKRPSVPDGAEGAWFTDDLWMMLNQCWATQPDSRPSIEAVLERLGQVSGTWEPPSPRAHEDAGGDDSDWGGWSGPPMGPTTPWTGGGGGGPLPWAQPPAAPLVPWRTGGGPIASMRDRSNEGLDTVGLFATGPHCECPAVAFSRYMLIAPTDGPVLTPLLLRVVSALLKVNPVLTAPTQDLDHVYLKWNMLFNASHCVRSDDKPENLWSNGRGSPATHPRLAEVKIISRSFPWNITVYAGDPTAGVTCGEIIDRLDDFLHGDLKKEDADLDSGNHRVERDHAYYHNRSTALGVPGSLLGEGLRRFDWLGKDTMFGGLGVDNGFTREYHGGATPPAILTLFCTRRYPLTEQELNEQKAREREEDARVRAAEERARVAEARAAELEEREMRRMRKARSHSRAGSVHTGDSGRSSARNRVSRTPSTEGTDDDDE